MKKKFIETKAAKIIKGLGNAAMDVLPIPDIRKYFDRNQDGKVSLSEVKWFELLSGVAILAGLIKFDIIQPEQVLQLLKVILSGG